MHISAEVGEDKERGESFWQDNVCIKEEPIEVQVVVIGAGCAGLQCAEKLYTSGK